MLTESERQDLFAQLDEIYGEVGVFASHLAGWEEDNSPRYLPTGAGSFDLVHAAVVRLAGGKRSKRLSVGWVNTLKAIIRSTHSHLWASGQAREVSVDAPRVSSGAERPEEDGAKTYGDTLANPIPNPEKLVLAKEHDAILNARLEEALDGDVEGMLVVAAVLDGAETRREISADTGIPVKRVRAIRQRLQRKMILLARQWMKGRPLKIDRPTRRPRRVAPAVEAAAKSDRTRGSRGSNPFGMSGLYFTSK